MQPFKMATSAHATALILDQSSTEKRYTFAAAAFPRVYISRSSKLSQHQYFCWRDCCPLFPEFGTLIFVPNRQFIFLNLFLIFYRTFCDHPFSNNVKNGTWEGDAQTTYKWNIIVV